MTALEAVAAARQHSAKVSAELTEAILCALDARESLRAIGEAAGMSHTQIANIRDDNK